MRRLALIIIAVMVFIAPVVGADMPGSHTNITVDEKMITALDSIYTIQDKVIPFTLWVTLYGTGLALLLVSILLHERGGVVTGFLSLGFIVVAWLNSVFIGFQDVVTYQIGDSLVVQPIVSVYGSHSLHLLVFLTFLVCLLNIILGVLNILAESAQTKHYNRRIGLK